MGGTLTVPVALSCSREEDMMDGIGVDQTRVIKGRWMMDCRGRREELTMGTERQLKGDDVAIEDGRSLDGAQVGWMDG